MAEKMYTVEEARAILMKATQEKVESFEKAIKALRERELKKATIPAHDHDPTMNAGAAHEDVPPGKANPKGIDKSMKKGELCKKCGKGHGLAKGCEMSKADLVDAKGKKSDSHTVKGSKTPEDVKSKKIDAKGSGGQIKPMAKSNPPMAKPPSGKNMGTSVPTSAPKAPAMKQPQAPAAPTMKSIDKIVVHDSKPAHPPKDAEYKAKKVGNDAVYEAKKDKVKTSLASPKDAGVTRKALDKAAISPDVKAQMKTHALNDSFKAAQPQAKAPQVKLPSQDEHAKRAQAFSDAMSGPSFQPQPKLASPKAAGVTRKMEKAAPPAIKPPGLTAMPALKNPALKQGYAYEHEEEKTKVVPPQAPSPNPKRAAKGQPQAVDLAADKVVHPGQTLGGPALASPKAAGVTRTPGQAPAQANAPSAPAQKPGIFGGKLARLFGKSEIVKSKK